MNLVVLMTSYVVVLDVKVIKGIVAYLSLQDELMIRFGSERLQKMMSRLGLDDSTPIESKMVSRAVRISTKTCRR